MTQKVFRNVILALVVFILAGLVAYIVLNKASITPLIIEPQSYVACGCGCCPGLEPQEQCLYHSQDDDIDKIIAEDKNASQNPDCPQMGCSFPIKYIYCD